MFVQTLYCSSFRFILRCASQCFLLCLPHASVSRSCCFPLLFRHDTPSPQISFRQTGPVTLFPLFYPFQRSFSILSLFLHPVINVCTHSLFHVAQCGILLSLSSCYVCYHYLLPLPHYSLSVHVIACHCFVPSHLIIMSMYVWFCPVLHSYQRMILVSSESFLTCFNCFHCFHRKLHPPSAHNHRFV